LKLNRFTRSGYVFVDWNTSGDGKGVSYANGATYPFTSSAKLYAQWKKVKVTPPISPIAGGVIIGPFAPGSSSLSPALKSEIQNLAVEAKNEKSTQVTLYGFADAAHASNAELGGA